MLSLVCFSRDTLAAAVRCLDELGTFLHSIPPVIGSIAQVFSSLSTLVFMALIHNTRNEDRDEDRNVKRYNRPRSLPPQYTTIGSFQIPSHTPQQGRLYDQLRKSLEWAR